MRILHIVPTYLPAVRYGGPIYAVHGLCRSLASRGHDVQVYTTNVDGVGTSHVPLLEPVFIDGVTVRYFPCGLGRRIYRSPAMGSALAANVAKFDLLHLHSVFLWPTLAAARAARRASVPYLLAAHGMLVGGLIERKSRLVKNTRIRFFEKDNVAGAAAVHAMSELERAELAKLGISVQKVVIVANGVDLPDLTQPCRRPAF